jgi:hypothetical protein
VLLLLPDLLTPDGSLIEFETIGFDVRPDDVCKYLLHGGDCVLPVAQEVQVTGGPVWRLLPRGEEQCTLEDEPVGVPGPAQAVEEPLHPVVDEHQLVVLGPLADPVQEASAHRGGQILRRPPTHPSASR